jgi:penicillin G amidase
MRRIRTALKIGGRVLLVIGVILAGTSLWFVQRPWPETHGTLQLPGLSAAVRIHRDRYGVPHIYADTEHDLMVAQGYVHAQDRLWQMEFNRRMGSGTLSAILGESTIGLDIYVRTLGLARAAAKDWELLHAETRALLQAYADGVNAYIELHRDRLPLEFSLLGVSPAPWTPADTLSWGKVMSLNLNGNSTFELLRARLIARLGARAVEQLMPRADSNAPLPIPYEVEQYPWLQAASGQHWDETAGIQRNTNLNWGSNSWVVGGSRTSSGQPILANDTHLGLTIPSVWYANGLHGGRFNVVGFSFPGVPLVILGRNEQIAWGVTNLVPDVQDMYVERLDDPIHPTRYEFMGQWRSLDIITETITLKDAPPIVLPVRISHHGPLVKASNDPKDTSLLAERWMATEGTRLLTAIVQINRAADWNDFRAALRFWGTPGQHFVYADRDGNIGYQAAGLIPRRTPNHTGLVPVPGWTGTYEWQGTIPFDELPSQLNPFDGMIITANNAVRTDASPYRLSVEHDPGYRAQRIRDLLTAQSPLDIEEMQRIQNDTFSLPAAQLRAYLKDIVPTTALQMDALAQLTSWDGRFDTDHIGALIFSTWYWCLVQQVLHDNLPEDLLDEFLTYEIIHVPFTIALLHDRTNEWFDDRTTPQIEQRSEIVQQSFERAVAWLEEHYGTAPERWTWGRAHTVTLVHQPFGQSGIKPLEMLVNSNRLPIGGDNFTVNATSFNFSAPFNTIGGPAQRLLIDLTGPDRSLMINSTGQSGHLFHPHQRDMLDLWLRGEYIPMYFSREAVEANTKDVLILVPGFG